MVVVQRKYYLCQIGQGCQQLESAFLTVLTFPRLHFFVIEEFETSERKCSNPRIVFPVALLPEPVRPTSIILTSSSEKSKTSSSI